jgi:hypothetical protein
MMRTAAVALGVAALAWSAPLRADTRSDIAAVEQAWGQAFLKGHRAWLEAVVAPEFKLMRAEANRTLFTPRADWFAAYERYIFHEFEVRTVDVVDAGDTAVATVTGRWKVGMQGREGTREENFIVSDTFVRRGGKWQVIYRHSSPFPIASPAAAPRRDERGR